MIARVLVPMDSSEMAGKALEYALETHPDAEITAYHVVGTPTVMMGEAVGLALADDLEAEAENALMSSSMPLVISPPNTMRQSKRKSGSVTRCERFSSPPRTMTR